MPDNPPQNLAHHARYDPPFHFFVLPVFAITLIGSVVSLVRHPDWTHLWTVIFVAALALAVVKTRQNPIRVQDRLIRLEERLRLATLLPESLRPQIAKLSEDQLIGLRFASDEEVPALMQRALSENLSRTDIKKAIKNWRPDYWRV
jgi:Family of unknown function (DUF6526)